MKKKTIHVTPDYIVIPLLPANPPLKTGLLWLCANRFRFSPDGINIQEFLNRFGDTLEENLSVATDKTVDGIDLDVHRHDGLAKHGAPIGASLSSAISDTASTTSTSPYTPAGFRFCVNLDGYNSGVLKGKLLAELRTNTTGIFARARIYNHTDDVAYPEISNDTTTYLLKETPWFDLPTTGSKVMSFQHWTDGATTQTRCWNFMIKRG